MGPRAGFQMQVVWPIIEVSLVLEHVVPMGMSML